jgi:hypothetical protein
MREYGSPFTTRFSLCSDVLHFHLEIQVLLPLHTKKLMAFEFLGDAKGVGEIDRVIFIVGAVECLGNEFFDAVVVQKVLGRRVFDRRWYIDIETIGVKNSNNLSKKGCSLGFGIKYFLKGILKLLLVLVLRIRVFHVMLQVVDELEASRHPA